MSSTVPEPENRSTEANFCPVGAHSDVWKHFKLHKENKKAQCNLCPKALTYCGGTTTLWRHLSTVHQIKAPNANTVAEQNSSSAPGAPTTTGPRQLSIQNSMARAKKVSLEEAVAYLAAHDRVSFRTIAESEIIKMGLRSLGLDAPDSHTTVAKYVKYFCSGKAFLEKCLSYVFFPESLFKKTFLVVSG